MDVAGSALEAIARYAPVIDVPPPAVLDQARRNIELQVALIQEFGAIAADKLGTLVGSKARRATATVDNWRRAHKVLAVRWHDDLLVPGFLLLGDAQPDPVARPALRALHAQGFSDWQATLWWAVSSSALAGRRPVDVLLAAREQTPANRDEVALQLAAAAGRSRNWF